MAQRAPHAAADVLRRQLRTDHRDGIDGERLTAVGYGEEKPLDEAKTEAAYQKNRRVDFFVDERAEP